MKPTDLKLDELIGQMLVVGFQGKSLPIEIKSALNKGRISGVILFTRNFENPAQITELCKEIRSEAKPLGGFIMVDHEGGKVRRFKQGFTVWPPMRSVGISGDEKIAEDVGR